MINTLIEIGVCITLIAGYSYLLYIVRRKSVKLSDVSTLYKEMYQCAGNDNVVLDYQKRKELKGVVKRVRNSDVIMHTIALLESDLNSSTFISVLVALSSPVFAFEIAFLVKQMKSSLLIFTNYSIEFDDELVSKAIMCIVVTFFLFAFVKNVSNTFRKKYFLEILKQEVSERTSLQGVDNGEESEVIKLDNCTGEMKERVENEISNNALNKCKVRRFWLKTNKTKVIKDITSKQDIWEISREDAQKALKDIPNNMFGKCSKMHYICVYELLKHKVESLSTKVEKNAYLESLEMNYKDMLDEKILGYIIALLSNGVIFNLFFETIPIITVTILIEIALIELVFKSNRKWDLYIKVLKQIRKDYVEKKE